MSYFKKIKNFIILLYRKIFYPNFNTIALPIARPIFARTLASELVSVQPLSLPTGLLFYMESDTIREDVFKRIVLIEKHGPVMFRRNVRRDF